MTSGARLLCIMGSGETAPTYLAFSAAELGGRYDAMLAELRPWMAEALDVPLPDRAFPNFTVLDRRGWIEVNLELFQGLLEPILKLQEMVPASLLTDLGRTGLSEYMGVMLGFLSRRVLGQYDIALLGETSTAGGKLYFVEPNLRMVEQTLGVPPDEPGEHSTRPPRPACGGNIDCRDLVAGSTLYLPVTVSGALLCIGDGHGAQGDGEVSGTAIECGMTSEIVVDLVTDPPVPTVHAVTPTSRITFGFSEDLNEAMAAALDAMLGWMQSLFTLDKAAALALASPTVDLRVTQVANDVWGVHAVLPHDAIR